MTFESSTVPERIKTARILRGMSQHALARAMGTKQSAVWTWEHGKTDLRPETILKIATALRVPMLWLAFGEGPIEAPINNEAPADTRASSSNSAR